MTWHFFFFNCGLTIVEDIVYSYRYNWRQDVFSAKAVLQQIIWYSCTQHQLTLSYAICHIYRSIQAELSALCGLVRFIYNFFQDYSCFLFHLFPNPLLFLFLVLPSFLFKIFASCLVNHILRRRCRLLLGPLDSGRCILRSIKFSIMILRAN